MHKSSFVADKIQVLEEEQQKMEAKKKLLEHEHQSLQLEFGNLQDAFAAYKVSVASREDPVVLRLALNQSRKDLSMAIEKVWSNQ